MKLKKDAVTSCEEMAVRDAVTSCEEMVVRCAQALEVFGGLLKAMRIMEDWQPKEIEDCLGTLNVNLLLLARSAQMTADQAVLVRQHKKYNPYTRSHHEPD